MPRTTIEQLALMPAPDTAHCPMVCVSENSKADLDLCTFCTVCPDQSKIPAGCDLSCGWPTRITAADCPYVYRCPCAKPCSGERAERMIMWGRGHKERTKWIMAASRPTPANATEEPPKEVAVNAGHFHCNVVVCS